MKRGCSGNADPSDSGRPPKRDCDTESKARALHAAEVAAKVERARFIGIWAQYDAQKARHKADDAAITANYITVQFNWRPAPPPPPPVTNIRTGELVPIQHRVLVEPTDAEGSRVLTPYQLGLQEEFWRQRELEPLPESENVAYHEQHLTLSESTGPQGLELSLEPGPLAIDRD